eukprot:58302-Karenia_brevis.AAC.1
MVRETRILSRRVGSQPLLTLKGDNKAATRVEPAVCSVPTPKQQRAAVARISHKSKAPEQMWILRSLSYLETRAILK